MNAHKRDLSQIIAVYLLLALLGGIIAEVMAGSFIFRAIVADLIMTVCIYCISLWKKNSSAYDAFWSVLPCLLTVWLWLKMGGKGWQIWQWATVIMVNVWSWRLTWNWARGWSGWGHQDWRYIDLKEQNQRLYPLINFFGIHLFPTVIVFVACLGLFDVASAQEFSAALMIVGLVIGTGGILLEFIADNQLAEFRRRSNPDRRDILDTGLWSVMRYPNYLGEMCFWWGLAICGLGAGGEWWIAVGALAMVALFVFVSIPMKDTHMRKVRPDLDTYHRRVPAFVPRWR